MLSNQESIGREEAEFNHFLIEHRTPEERLPAVKAILARSGITRRNLRDAIELYQSRMGEGVPFPGFSGDDKTIEQLAVALQADEMQYRFHYEEPD